MAAKSKDIRPKITMTCTVCKERSYIAKKNRHNTPDRLRLDKYCPCCKESTLHKETRWVLLVPEFKPP